MSPEHYVQLILHRWWLVLSALVVIAGGTAIVTSQLPDVFTSYTTILVDPQKVPETYVKPTVTGDVRNRLGTLSQQILSATRLQKIIDTFNLYAAERKTMAREDIISMMRKNIDVTLVSGGTNQDLEAFRITYSGRDPRLVAQVTNELASLFIEENLKAREQQATGTTEFLENQLGETRQALELQEAKLRDFKLKHIGEMPEQQTADLQVLGNLQSQLQLEAEALNRAEEQKSYVQSVMAQASDSPAPESAGAGPQAVSPGAGKAAAPAPRTQLDIDKARLAAMLAHGYTEEHPDVRMLKAQMARDEADAARLPVPVPAAADPIGPQQGATARVSTPAPKRPNLVLEAQLRNAEDEIQKHKSEQERLMKLVAGYQAKVEAIPVREQQISDLVRDYEISKVHYQQLLNNQLSAETATQLEIRQKGEKFSVLDPAQPAQRPSKPNRMLLNAAGAAAGLVIGLLLSLVSEFLGMSISSAEQITAATGLPVLEVIPTIRTHADRVVRRRRMVLAAISVALTVMAASAAVAFHYRNQLF